MTEREVFLLQVVPPGCPPCFADRSQWLEYLRACERDCMAHALLSGPVKGQGKSPADMALNPDFSFCADCDAQYRTDMLAADKCQPLWLKQAHERQAAEAP